MKDEFVTTACELAAWLSAIGYEVVKIERTGEWLSFHFPAEAQEAVQGRWKGAEGKAARSLIRSYRTVRGLVFANSKRATA